MLVLSHQSGVVSGAVIDRLRDDASLALGLVVWEEVRVVWGEVLMKLISQLEQSLTCIYPLWVE